MGTINDTSDILLVPVKVDAMIVNRALRFGKDINFRRFQMQYENLNFFTKAEPDTFADNSGDFCNNKENDGIYLHWSIPDALKHGVQKEDGSGIQFPLVPNRWLVVRYNSSANSAKAWVIDSDFFGLNSGKSAFIDPFPHTIDQNQDQNQDKNKKIKATLIGRSSELEKWEESGKDMFLTAVAPGNITFSAYQPFVDSVFSFHDAMDDMPPEVPISYMVAGWYSDATKDPFYNCGSKCSELLDQFKWIVDKNDSAKNPARLVCHGMVCGVEWSKDGGVPAKNNYPNPDNINVAIGNTSIDALIAILKGQVQKDQKNETHYINAQLLEAFQYNVLDAMGKPGGQEKLQQVMHQACFGKLQGGTLWKIVNKQVKNELYNTDDTGVNIDNGFQLTDDEEKLICFLNSAQREIDIKQRELNSEQIELYALLWYKEYLKSQGEDYTDVFAKLSKADIEVVNTSSELVTLQSKMPSLTTTCDIDEVIKGFAKNMGLKISEDRTMKKIAKPDFYLPTDPAVLITGIKGSRAFNTGKDLRCRYDDETITRLYDNTQLIEAGMGTTLINTGLLPAILKDVFIKLLNEFCLLEQIVKDGGFEAKQIKKANDIEQFPSMGLEEWSQPWSPLFIEWQVKWYPVEFESYNGGNKVTNWLFDGEDYAFNQKNNNSVSIMEDSYKKYGIPISGRTFLTPQSAFAFKHRLNKFVHDNPNEDLSQLAKILGESDNWDILSQTMSGFTDKLTMLDRYTGLIPELIQETIAKHIGDQYNTVPVLQDSFFQGVRSGQMNFEKLYIIDSFGQAIDIIKTVNADYNHPIIPESLTPQKPIDSEESYRFIQLPPRMLQAARLNFDFTATDDDTKILDYDIGVNPVCGWLLPNHLERAIDVFDNGGEFLGELCLSDDGSKVVWVEAPRGNITNLDILQTSYKHVGEIMKSIQRAGANAFNDMMNTVDETLWTIDPLGDRFDQFLSVLIGRPIAVVRGRLQFELNGPPMKDLSKEIGFKASMYGDFTNYNYNVKLGNFELRDDGIIGYYLNDDYTQYNSIHIPDYLIDGEEKQQYISQIGVNPNSDSANFITLNLNDKDTAYVTMMIDPRAQLHAYTGILPVKTLSLPYSFILNAFTKMELYFRTETVLTDASIQDGICMPMPGERNGEWVWMENVNGDWSDDLQLVKVDQTAMLRTTAPILKEGVLKLRKVVV